MHDTTRLPSAIEYGDGQAAEQLLPLIYDELHRLAAELVAREPSGQTLEATALVNEAYLRLVEPSRTQNWNGPPISSPPRRRRCGGSWSNMPGTGVPVSMEEAGIEYRSTTFRSRTVSTMATRLTTSLPSTRPSSGSQPRTRSRPSLSSSATSPGSQSKKPPVCWGSPELRPNATGPMPGYGSMLS